MAKTPYEIIKNIQAKSGIPYKNLLALDRTNDPFFVGSENDLKIANWFTELWQRFSLGQGVHLRRIHYLLFVQSPSIKRPDGKAYGNTDRDWAYLNKAAKAARYLDMVPAHSFVDRRNADPIINRQHEPKITPDFDIEDNFFLPQIPQIPLLPNFPLLPDTPDIQACGYNTIQPYLLEVWAEKSAINDVVLPICQHYQVNYVYGMGEMSITSVLEYLERLREGREESGINLAGHIFYISDYDKAGQGMPVSISRKIEFYQKKYTAYKDLQITVHPLALTPQQIKKYNLPRKPGKYKKEGWSDGVVELDALEALVPGELATILESAILNYYDENLEDKNNLALNILQENLEAEKGMIINDYLDQIDALEQEIEGISQKWQATQQEFAKITASFDQTREDLQDKLNTVMDAYKFVNQEILTELSDINPSFPDEPTPQLNPTKETLYNSTRDYFKQLQAYNKHKKNTKGQM